MKKISRGDLYYANLNSCVVGSEQNGYRPVIVVQNDIGNMFSPTVIVAVLTSRLKKRLPTHIFISAKECNLERDSTVLLEQIKTIDKYILDKYIGHITDQKMNEINAAMIVSLGL